MIFAVLALEHGQLGLQGLDLVLRGDHRPAVGQDGGLHLVDLGELGFQQDAALLRRLQLALHFQQLVLGALDDLQVELGQLGQAVLVLFLIAGELGLQGFYRLVGALHLGAQELAGLGGLHGARAHVLFQVQGDEFVGDLLRGLRVLVFEAHRERDGVDAGPTGARIGELDVHQVHLHLLLHVFHQQQGGQVLALLGVQVELLDDARHVGAGHHALVDQLDLLGREGGDRGLHQFLRHLGFLDQDHRGGGVLGGPQEGDQRADDEHQRGGDQAEFLAALECGDKVAKALALFGKKFPFIYHWAFSEEPYAVQLVIVITSDDRSGL